MKMMRGVLILALLAFLLGLPSDGGAAGPKIYWHFTFKAYVHMPDTSAVEWAWVTMVEYDKAKANPMADETIREFGGTLKGTLFAFVRGAAWRSSFKYELDDTCHSRPAKKTISWGESDSDSVFCAGGFFDPRPVRDGTGRVTLGPPKFRLGFTNRMILHEDGSWEDLKNQTRVFVGAVQVEGRAGENTKGDFYFQEVNYRDDLEHHKSCDKTWVEQYRPGFGHFHHQALEDDIPDLGDVIRGVVRYGPRHRNQIVYEAVRLTSPEHPHWKIKPEWIRPSLEPGEGGRSSVPPAGSDR